MTHVHNLYHNYLQYRLHSLHYAIHALIKEANVAIDLVDVSYA